FIHSHPELQMLPPRVWRTHYEDECKQENRTYAFSSLRQYSSLVRIQKLGRCNLYGSAKIPAKVLSNSSVKSSNNSARSQQKNGKSVNNQQLELEYLPQSAQKEIHNLMLETSAKIQQIVQRTKNKETKIEN
ncbi:MAG: hypothetical protein ACRC8K_08445, partial [Waterburya sp.]